MFLKHEDVEVLTGATHTALQMEWLKANGFPYSVNRAGKPIVLSSVVERKLGGATVRIKKEVEPDFTPLHKPKKPRIH